MPPERRVLALFLLAALCAAGSIVVLWLSPNPFPAPHAELLTVLIAGFSATVAALLRILVGSSGKGLKKTGELKAQK